MIADSMEYGKCIIYLENKTNFQFFFDMLVRENAVMLIQPLLHVPSLVPRT